MNEIKNQVLLKGRQIRKNFRRGEENTEVLKGIDIDIYDQDFTVIMGSSGAGKSTLLYSLSGMDTIDEGEIYYKSKKVSGLNEKEQARLRAREYGFVFQQTHLVSNLSLIENVAVAGYLAGKSTSAEVDKKAEDILQKMGIGSLENRYVNQVSGGEAQRAAIARAVIGEPGILFADEPTGALNRAGSENVLKIFTGLNENGQSILMVTHDVNAAIRGNRVLYLDDGKLMGELELGAYQEIDGKEREERLNEWLLGLHW